MFPGQYQHVHIPRPGSTGGHPLHRAWFSGQIRDKIEAADGQVLIPQEVARLQVGHKIMVRSPRKRWRHSIVLAMPGLAEAVKVRYQGYDEFFDEWIPVQSCRIRVGARVRV